MTVTTTAVYENGVLRPVRPLALADGAVVQVTVSPPRPSDAEIVRPRRVPRSSARRAGTR